MKRSEALKIVRKAYSQLSRVPADEWITHVTTDGVSKCCGLGHYERLNNGSPNIYLDIWIKNYSRILENAIYTITDDIFLGDVNDGKKGYDKLGDNPKARTMKFLNDLAWNSESKFLAF